MIGKAAPVVPLLQSAATWGDMTKSFEEYFAVSRNVILSELQAMRCDKFEVGKYIASFNQVKAKYYW